MKTWMTIHASIVGLFLSLIAAIPAANAEIVVEATGFVGVMPDRASIDVWFIVRGESRTGVVDENSQRYNAFLDTLRSIGIADDMIAELRYSVQPTSATVDRRSKWATGSRRFYAARKVRIHTKDFGSLDDIAQSAIAVGAASTGQVRFIATKTDEARQQAYESAVKQAWTDADTLARHSGGFLGRLIEMRTSDRAGPVVVSDSEPWTVNWTFLVPHELSVTVTVNGRWSFTSEPKPTD